MSIEDRQKQFQDSMVESLGDNASVNVNFGISNIARVISGGIIVGVANLVTLGQKKDKTSLSYLSRICPYPDVEVYFAITIKSGIQDIFYRLDAMIALGGSGDQHFTDSNKNVGLCLDNNGLAYLFHSKSYPPVNPAELIHPLPTFLNPGIEVESINYSVYADTPGKYTRPAVTGLIDMFRQLVGDERVHNKDLWGRGGTLPEDMRRQPADVSLDEIRESISLLGGHYQKEIVNRLHFGLTYLENRHFVLLTGVSGTGKTGIAVKYAYAVHGLTDLRDENPLLFMCRVRPDWTDPSGLLGYVDIVTQNYTVPAFLEAIFTANRNPSSPVFVCLDEMNLARVEYYFADILSAMETPEVPVRLHSNSEPYTGDAGFEVPNSFYWPRNLYIVGTMNVDETTGIPSPKVLDRAVVIDMSEIDLSGFFNKVKSESEEIKKLVEICEEPLNKCYNSMRRHQLGFGYRATDDVIRYVLAAKEKDTIEEDVRILVDQQILQKILTKLRGTHEQASMLEELRGHLTGFNESREFVISLEKRLEEIGSFNAIQAMA